MRLQINLALLGLGLVGSALAEYYCVCLPIHVCTCQLGIRREASNTARRVALTVKRTQCMPGCRVCLPRWNCGGDDGDCTHRIVSTPDPTYIAACVSHVCFKQVYQLGGMSLTLPANHSSAPAAPTRRRSPPSSWPRRSTSSLSPLRKHGQRSQRTTRGQDQGGFLDA